MSRTLNIEFDERTECSQGLVLGGLVGYDVEVRSDNVNADVRLYRMTWSHEKGGWGFTYRKLDDVRREPYGDRRFLPVNEISHIHIS